MIVTAGHCTFGSGMNGVSTTNGGKDDNSRRTATAAMILGRFRRGSPLRWVPGEADYEPRDENRSAMSTASTFLESQPDLASRNRRFPHPQYDDNAFFLFDAGVVVLDVSGRLEHLRRARPPRLPRALSLDRANEHRFEAVGYGLEKVLGFKESGGDTRMKSEPKLNSLQGNPRDTYIVLSNNTKTGGTCFGDSGGPTFDDTNSNLVVAVTSWGQSPNCTGKGGAYRLDQPDDQAFLASHGIAP